MRKYRITALCSLLLAMFTCIIGGATVAEPVIQKVCVIAVSVFLTVGMTSFVLAVWKDR